MQLDVGIRALVQKWTDAARLFSRQKMADYSPGGKDERLFGIRYFRGR